VTRILELMKIKKPPYVIAIVDDDQMVLESLGNLLESAGYSVRLFACAEAFLRGDTLNEIDALISDIRMPGIDGIELQLQVGVTRPDLPVILVTARNDHDPTRTRQPNNRAVFCKPIDAAELVKTVATVVKENP